MDNDKYIGFTLIMLLIITYYVFFPPGQSINNQDQVSNTEKDIVINDEDIEVNQTNEFTSQEEGEKITLENDLFTVEFNSRGGIIENVFLKNYTNNNSEIVHLYNEKESIINFKLSNQNINFDNILFSYDVNKQTDNKILNFTSISDILLKSSYHYQRLK